MLKTEQHIIEACRKGDRKAQNLLFEKYQGILFGVCLRYAANEAEAEDMFQEGMLTIFQNLYQYRPIGSFKGWLKKVMVNCCLQVLRSKKNIFTVTLMDQQLNAVEESSAYENPITEEMLLKFIQQLPIGYRTVFNLYVIEGYTHQEIGQYLNISANTSKSQLSRAKKLLRSLIETAFYAVSYTHLTLPTTPYV